MNKKLNTLFFLLAATLFNIMVTLAGFLLLMLIYAKFIMPLFPEAVQIWGLAIIFIIAIVISFFVYRFALKLLMKKVKMEDYFAPIFRAKR